MKRRKKILIVDDTEINRSLLSDMLSEQYEVLEAKNGLEAVACLNQYGTDISLILLDIVMPEMDGFEVLATMNNKGYIEGIPVIVISAENGNSYIDHAYDLGAVEYIGRPFDEKTVLRRVKNIIMLYTKQKMLEDTVIDQMLAREKTNLMMVEILSHIVEFRNGESGLHVIRIRIITEMLLKRLARMTKQYDLPLPYISLVANASALHDIGKISVPEGILNKPGKLTPDEYEIMKIHSVAGAEMLEKVSYFESEELVKMARDICRWHHERYDGKGYPDGLVGEEIPISAQVVSLADVYDALTSERVYKPAYSHQEALQMITNGECGAFNPLLIQCITEMSDYLEQELKLRSAGKPSMKEIQNAAHSLMQNGTVSNRTLALLEQERTKYQFFASMSNEIQFEYDAQADVLTISDWGAAWLGIPAVITHPQTSEELKNVFPEKDYLDLQTRLYATTPDNPVASNSYLLNVKGERRWYKAVARPLWENDELGKYTGIIGKFVDVHNERVENEQLKTMAQHDGLTGLYNKEYARKLIDRDLRMGLADERNYAFLLFDLDLFKTANDQYGHLFGDEVLKEIAKRLKSCARDTDVLARVGGDEYLLFLEYKEDISPIIKRFFAALNKPYKSFDVRVSIGISLAPKNGAKYEELFHRADQALYAAKQQGRNKHCYYDESMKDMLSILTPVESEENR